MPRMEHPMLLITRILRALEVEHGINYDGMLTTLGKHGIVCKPPDHTQPIDHEHVLELEAIVIDDSTYLWNPLDDVVYTFCTKPVPIGKLDDNDALVMYT